MVIPALAQPLEIGIRGGFRPTSQLAVPLQGFADSESRPYLVGPMAQLNLPRGFAVEVDALYSPFGYSTSYRDFFGDSYTSRDRANSWQFPVLVKYRFQLAGMHPYVLLGWDPEHATGATKTSALLVSNPYDINYTLTYQQYSAADQYGTNHGAVGGVGMEFGWRHVRVIPEARYVRWKDSMYPYYGVRGPRNEVQLMVGVAWH
jgi:hypothetical protein